MQPKPCPSDSAESSITANDLAQTPLTANESDPVRPSALALHGGGAASEAQRVQVRVQSADFSVQTELDALRAALGSAGAAGAICSFVGLVRSPEGHVPNPAEQPPAPLLWLEHYPGMTERSITHLAEAALQRFGALAACVVHRVGPLALGEQIVLVAVLAPHRRAAFEACECLMDQLKTQAPFWKQELRNGQRHWVDAKTSDDQAAQRW